MRRATSSSCSPGGRAREGGPWMRYVPALPSRPADRPAGHPALACGSLAYPGGKPGRRALPFWSQTPVPGADHLSGRKRELSPSALVRALWGSGQRPGRNAPRVRPARLPARRQRALRSPREPPARESRPPALRPASAAGTWRAAPGRDPGISAQLPPPLRRPARLRPGVR